jgi:hypothetical protein
MRDLNALVTSLVNVDRDNLTAILSSEAAAAARLAKSMPQRTRSQNARRSEVIDRAARINCILPFVRHGEKDPAMSEASIFANLLKESCVPEGRHNRSETFGTYCFLPVGKAE